MVVRRDAHRFVALLRISDVPRRQGSSETERARRQQHVLYRTEDGPGRLFRFTAATLARLSDGQTLEASQAATVLTIPDHAQGAAIGGGGLWIARSDWNWGTLDRLDPVTGAPQRRYEIAPGTEGLAFGNAGRLWAVSEAGSRHIYDHPFLDLFQPFFPLVFALDLSKGARHIYGSAQRAARLQ
jgi:hypothetical protein